MMAENPTWLCAITGVANTNARAMYNAANSNTFLKVPPPVAALHQKSP
jgi:hypothetical protein